MTDSITDILVDIIDGTAVLTINRENVFNALNKSAKLELASKVQQYDEDPSIKSIVITAKGKAFCSGQDLNDRANKDVKADLGDTLKKEWNPLVMSIRNAKKIVICAVNGVAAGAGVSVALACDLIVAKSGVKFVSGFSKIGLTADAGSTFTLTRSLGRKKALAFFLFNNPLTSEELLDAGIILKVTENDPLTDALEVARNINIMAPLSVQILKSNTLKAEQMGYNEMIEVETDTQRMLGNSFDFQEGVNAFFEKRTAKFQGK